MIIPQQLKQGDKIGLIAPSRKVTLNDIEGSVRLLESWGYQVVFGKNLFYEQNQFAGTDHERAQDVMQMMQDPEIKAILCARGGYGTVRLLEHLKPEIMKQNPKWLIGYSDITVLHSYFNKVLNCATLHATMPVNCNEITSASGTWQQLKVIFNNKPLEYMESSHAFNKPGVSEGELVGGNLSVLFSLRGTFCDIDTDGKILFLEDLDEYLYHIDRMMMNLKLGGKLKNLKGLIIGGMTEMKDNTIPFGKTAYEIVADAVKDYNYPVMYDFPAGHCEPNLPLIFGRNVQIEVNAEKAQIKFS